MKNILFPTDFSENSNHALTFALNLAKDFGARLHILNAYKHAFDEGYAGAMSWDITGFKDGVNPTHIQNLTTSAPAMTALFAANEADIKIKDVVRDDNSDKNGVMEVGFNIT